MGKRKLSLDEQARVLAWFYEYVARFDAQPSDLPLRCPCCRRRTLTQRASYDICPVCFWEDDGQDDYDADVVRGGPNGRLSLTDARESYLLHGACEHRFIDKVRSPRPDEQR